MEYLPTKSWKLLVNSTYVTHSYEVFLKNSKLMMVLGMQSFRRFI